MSSRWTMSPIKFSGPAGESNPDFLVAGQASSRWTSSSYRRLKFRPGIEPGLPPYRGGVLPKTLTDQIISDPGWNRTIGLLDVTQASLPLDYGIVQVTGVRVELTNS